VREGLHKISSSDDTIVALSTPMGRSALGVVRVSGPLASTIGQQFLRGGNLSNARQAVVGTWQDSNGIVIDEVVVTFYKAPQSYTGEDVLEVSAHGNPLVLQQIICMVQSAGARLARPGEFTLRAVTHGKMDLIQAEAIRDFIEAQTTVQARTAMRQLGGALSRKIRPVKDALIGLIAHLEAGIDFAEDDVESPDSHRSVAELGALKKALNDLQETYAYGRLLNAGVRIVILGKPNVGKSSLFNRLVDADRAIVTDLPGTTRDVITESTSLDGIPIKVFDTAGLRETGDVVERLGVVRALETIADADFILFVVDGSLPIDSADRAAWEKIREYPHIVVANKADLTAADDPELEGLPPIRASARTGQGLGELRAAIRDALGHGHSEELADSVLTTTRQNDAVVCAIANLERAETALTERTPHEMVLLDLYESLGCLNELTGETTTEDILGRIFSTFCIGK
jgi:tRNA modification GTPase